MIKQLQSSKQEIIAAHRKKRRRCAWNEDTPMRKLVNNYYESQFITMMKEWEKYTTHVIHPLKTSQFTFDPKYSKRPVYAALAQLLSSGSRVLTISTMALCRYLEAHTNLGTARSIHRGLYRMM